MRSAVILSGGSSKRLGDDKGLRGLAGKPLIMYGYEALRPLVDEVVIVVGSDAQLRAYQSCLRVSARMRVDLYKGGSPLVGLATGLAEARGEYALVAACDMPFISQRPVELLFDKAEGRDGAVFSKPDGWIEPLLAVYRVATCLPEALRLHRVGDLRIRMVLRNLGDVAYVPSSSSGVDPGILFFDADTEEKLAAAECMIRGIKD